MSDQHRQKRIIILGALSAIGEATARLFARDGARIILAGRDRNRLEQVAIDLKTRGAELCVPWALDLALVEDPNHEIQRMAEALEGPVDVVMLFYGMLGDQAAAENDIETLRKIISVNFSSAAEWCIAAARLVEHQQNGVLVAMSSVAGDRGRQSNYIYGAAKAGLTTLMEGIAHRLAKTNARAIAVKLGPVDTPMTVHMKKGGLLWSRPDSIARKLKQLVEAGRRPVVYMPTFWRPIMMLIRSVPAPIFHKTRF